MVVNANLAVLNAECGFAVEFHVFDTVNELCRCQEVPLRVGSIQRYVDVRVRSKINDDPANHSHKRTLGKPDQLVDVSYSESR